MCIYIACLTCIVVTRYSYPLNCKLLYLADGLTVVPVGSYSEIEHRMEEGTRNRTVAATKMNATSR